MKSDRIEELAENGPYAVGLCECHVCKSKGGRWLVHRADMEPRVGFISDLAFKHKRSAQRVANRLNLAYAKHIMVQP